MRLFASSGNSGGAPKETSLRGSAGGPSLRRINSRARARGQNARMSDRPLILLLVEDEPLREALRFSLETEGYAVGVRPDGRPVAAVVIDDAREAWPTLSESPTIVLTGDVERFQRRGVRGVSLVEKPLLGDALSERLSEVLKSPDLPGERRDPDLKARELMERARSS